MFSDDAPEEAWVTPSRDNAMKAKDVPPKPQKLHKSKSQLDLQHPAAGGKTKPLKTKPPAAVKDKLQNASLKNGAATAVVQKKPAGKSDVVGKVPLPKSNV